MLNSLAYLGFSSIADIEKMTVVEYQLRMEAYQLQEVAAKNHIAMQAWMNQSAKATKGSSKHPKPKFEHLKDLYDYQAEVDDIRSAYEPNYRVANMSKRELTASRAQIFAKRMREFEQLKKQGKIIPISERKEVKHGRKL